MDNVKRMIREYDTYIFDLDGTLLDTLTDLAASCNYALQQHGMAQRTIDEGRAYVCWQWCKKTDGACHSRWFGQSTVR